MALYKRKTVGGNKGRRNHRYIFAKTICFTKANYYVNKMYSQDDILEYNDVLKDIVNDMKIDENIGKTTENMAKITYDSEEQRLKQWIRERIDWIDKNISSINDYCASRQFVFR